MMSNKKAILGKYILPLILMCLHIALVFGRDRVTFHAPAEKGGLFYVCLLLFVLFTYGFYFVAEQVLIRLIRKDEVFLSYFKYFLGYFVFMGVFFLLTWPGIFKGDEFYTVRAALDFQLSGAQSGLTSLLYIVALLFFPSMASIVFVQLLLICAIFALVFHDLMTRFHTKAKVLLILPFILLPVIDANLFTLRATLVGWLFLLLLDRIFVLDRTADGLNKVVIAALCGLICAWRSEFIYLILLVPVCILWLKKATWKKAALLLLAAVLCWQIFNVPNKVALAGQNKYPISLVLNPLANMFTEEEKIHGPSVYEDVLTIGELVDVKRLRLDATAGNISQYWIIPDVLPKEQLSRFMKASLRLIIYNPGLYLKYRVKTFMLTNGYQDGVVNHPGGEDPDAILNLNYYDTDYRGYFAFMDPPLGQSLREKTISFLACRTYRKDGVTNRPWLKLFYNVIPPLCLLVVSLFYQIIKRRRKESLLIALTLLQFPLVFLTAPAMFFMYYFCLYLCGWVLVIYTLVCLNEDARKPVAPTVSRAE